MCLCRCSAVPTKSSSRSTRRLEGEARPLAHHITKARRIDVGAGDGEAFACRQVEDAFARLDRLILVEIVSQRRVRMRNLDRREVHHVAERHETAARCGEQPAGVSWRMAGRQYRREAKILLAVAHMPDAVEIGFQV